jgi:hypothetical protein
MVRELLTSHRRATSVPTCRPHTLWRSSATNHADLGIGLHAVAKKRDRPIAVREWTDVGCEVPATLDLAVG